MQKSINKYFNHGIISLIEMKLCFRHVIKVDDMETDSWDRVMKIFSQKMGIELFSSTVDKEQRIEWFIAISQQWLEDFIYAYKNKDIQSMATLLWYPLCCIGNYTRVASIVWDNPRVDDYFLNQSKTRTEKKTIFNTHISEGWLMIHYPCAFSCQETMYRNKKIFKLMTKIIPIQEIKSYLQKFHHI